MDTNILGNDVHNINILIAIASESYDSFANDLQTEIAEIATVQMSLSIQLLRADLA